MARKAGLLAAGALTAVGLLGILTIGILLLALAAGLLALLWRRRIDGVAYVLGGAALAFAAIGIAELPYTTCEGTLVAAPGETASCSGSTHPAVLFVPAALALIGTAVAAMKAP